MTTIDQLIAAARANPADRTTRFALADCLNERGGPGDKEAAEYLLAYIELERLNSDKPPRRLMRRIAKLESRLRRLKHQIQPPPTPPRPPHLSP
jgi:uncharacterized protein (TIGR02996 family)